MLTVITAVAVTFGSFSDRYHVYNQLENALINGNTSSVSNLKVLEDAFFPMQIPEPVCVTIKYSLICNDDTDLEAVEMNLTQQYLWTEYYIPYTTSILLFSFSRSGITLRGFEWEDSCLFMNTTEIELRLDSDSVNCLSKDVEDALKDLTSQVCT